MTKIQKRRMFAGIACLALVILVVFVSNPILGGVSLAGLLPAGLIGNGSGKVGNIVLSKWKSIATVRAYQPNVRQNETTALLTVRDRFKKVQHVASVCIAFANIGFQKFTSNMSAYNYFIKQNITTALSGSYPSFAYDYSEFVFSAGTLVNPDDAYAATFTDTSVTIAWTDNSGIGNALATDIPYALVICEGSDLTGLVKMHTAGTREDESYCNHDSGFLDR